MRIKVRTGTALATVMLTAACASPAGGAARTGWSAPALIDAPQGNLAAVSCPEPGSCVAVDNLGNALIYDGTSWTVPARQTRAPSPRSPARAATVSAAIPTGGRAPSSRCGPAG
jgi:hypothetical protein